MRQKGSNAILAIAIFVTSLVFGAFAIDIGTFYTVNRQVQAAADAAALAGIQELFKIEEPDPGTREETARQEALEVAQLNWANIVEGSDVTFGYVDPDTMEYDEATFSSSQPAQFPLTNGNNAIKVVIRRSDNVQNGTIPTTFARIFGVDSMDTLAEAVAVYPGDPNGITGEMRPFFLCESAYEIARQEYGDPTIPLITFYGDTFSVGETTYNNSDHCPCFPNGGEGSACSNPPGSWGLVDFAPGGGAPGSAEIHEWIENGYDGKVSKGDLMHPQTGTGGLQSATSELQGLISSQKVFPIPLYDEAYEQGQTATFNLSGIAGFQLADFRLSGKASYLQGHFKRKICTASQCDYQGPSTGTAGSLTTVRLVH